MSKSISTRIARYKAWLARQPMDRPLFGLCWEPDISPFPAFIERVGVGCEISPDQIHPEEVVPAIERWYQRDTQLAADTFQRFCPAFGIPWVEAIAGCRVILHPGSLWAEPILESYSGRPPIQLDPDNPWMRKLIEFTKVARMPPSLLRGGMASGGLGAAAPNTIIPLGMPRSLLRGGLLVSWWSSRTDGFPWPCPRCAAP